MVKFVNILIGGAITPVNVEDVVTVAATASGGSGADEYARPKPIANVGQ